MEGIKRKHRALNGLNGFHTKILSKLLSCVISGLRRDVDEGCTPDWSAGLLPKE